MQSPIRGQYQPLEKLGSGGMGEVYKARDLKLNRMVALKVLRPDQSGDPERRQRFMQEAQAASALNHPNIITIHDVLSEDGIEIMVMEMVAGRTLNEVIPRGGLRVSQVIKYSAQIADALAAAHGAGIIHRDLKPGNIMVTDRDLVKLLDFGLAKLDHSAMNGDPEATNVAPLTVQGSIVGTLCYMSPEQALGKPADARSDIFSFGAVLYEMATGLRAFNGENGISMLSSVLRDEPRRVLEITPEVPPILSDVIHRCLQKSPDARFQTMAELRDGLMRLRQLSDSGNLYTAAQLPSTIIAPPSGQRPVLPPAPPPSSRMPLVALAGVAVIGLAASAWWFTRSKEAGSVPPPAPAPVTAVADPPPVVEQSTPGQSPVPSKPSPTAPAPAAAAVPPSPTAPSQPTAAAGLMVSIPDATPIQLELLNDIPVDVEPGFALLFKAAADVKVGPEVVIAKGATAAGEVYAREKKKQFLVVGRGSKITILLKSVSSLDGTKLKIRATADADPEPIRTIETPGQKSKTIAVSKGTQTLGYTAGQQAVRVKR